VHCHILPPSSARALEGRQPAGDVRHIGDAHFMQCLGRQC
jgi:hypothetical protein